MGIDPTGLPHVSMRLGNDHAVGKRQVQFNEALNRANSDNGLQQTDDDDASSPKTTPQPKAIGGCPGLCFDQDTFDASIKAENDRIDAQIAEDREISRTPFEDRLRGARLSLIRNSDVGDVRQTLSRTTGDELYTYGRNNGYPINPLFPERGTLPSFTSNEKNAVKEAQGETQKEIQQHINEDNKRKLARVQSEQYQNWVNQGEQRRSPGPMVTGMAVCMATGPYGCAIYSSAQTAPVVADAYDACKSGSPTDCVVGVAHATVAVVQDIGMIKSVQTKVPRVDPHSKVTTEKTTPPAEPSAVPIPAARGPAAIRPTPIAQGIDQTLMELRTQATELTRRVSSSGTQFSATKFGSVNDAIFKSLVKQAIQEGRLPATMRTSPSSMNRPGSAGIDVWDTATGRGWDLTTARGEQVLGHDVRYRGVQAPDGTMIHDVTPLVYSR